ncbi:piggyBac transposable element-derived protein 4-like [Penaeus chinensis]|uniref:piggyBac transposable element-derived protein 4-like n=1 Tax=Penaeus chinensis TaxID=139456 RepID=UPI001FB58BBD|nr:piggyBac transposable element-derived protein 4-like [Penaeus chinensis]
MGWLSRKTSAVGTVCLNRHHMPRDLKIRKRGDVDSRSSPTGMLAQSWMDVKQVNMLSTVHTSHMVQVQRRGGLLVAKPECVVAYNDV